MIISGDTYKERSLKQLDEWVAGNYLHNDIDNECCPDFACCRPHLAQPLEIRKAFKAIVAKADEEQFNPDYHPFEDAKMAMLYGFLGNLQADTIQRRVVYLIGESEYNALLN